MPWITGCSRKRAVSIFPFNYLLHQVQEWDILSKCILGNIKSCCTFHLFFFFSSMYKFSWDCSLFLEGTVPLSFNDLFKHQAGSQCPRVQSQELAEVVSQRFTVEKEEFYSTHAPYGCTATPAITLVLVSNCKVIQIKHLTCQIHLFHWVSFCWVCIFPGFSELNVLGMRWA